MVYEGDVTFYTDWKFNYGSCGLDRSKTDPFYVAALSTRFMGGGGGNPNNHPLCEPNRGIQIWGKRNKSVVLKISDTCQGCKDYDVDVADSIYHHLGDPNQGRIRMKWDFVNLRNVSPGVYPA